MLLVLVLTLSILEQVADHMAVFMRRWPCIKSSRLLLLLADLCGPSIPLLLGVLPPVALDISVFLDGGAPCFKISMQFQFSSVLPLAGAQPFLRTQPLPGKQAFSVTCHL